MVCHLMQGKPIYWNEYGVGGGSSQNGNVVATTAAVAAANPYFGIFGSYNSSLDPWDLSNLNQPSQVREYLEYFYNQTILYANETGVSLSVSSDIATEKNFGLCCSTVVLFNFSELLESQIAS